MIPLDTWPPMADYAPDSSVGVALVYADGSTARGYRCGWLGWMRWGDDGVPRSVEDDAEQPVAWREVNE